MACKRRLEKSRCKSEEAVFLFVYYNVDFDCFHLKRRDYPHVYAVYLLFCEKLRHRPRTFYIHRIRSGKHVEHVFDHRQSHQHLSCNVNGNHVRRVRCGYGVANGVCRALLACNTLSDVQKKAVCADERTRVRNPNRQQTLPDYRHMRAVRGQPFCLRYPLTSASKCGLYLCPLAAYCLLQARSQRLRKRNL